MKILVAEYASVAALGGTCELEGRAMLSVLVESFQKSGHEVVYPTAGLTIGGGKPILLKRLEEFEEVLQTAKVDAGLLIAPDEMQPHLLEILEEEHRKPGLQPHCCKPMRRQAALYPKAKGERSPGGRDRCQA